MINVFVTLSTGIDITDSSIRLVSLSKKRKIINLDGYSKVSLPIGVVEKGEIKDEKLFQEHLISLFKNITGDKKVSGEIISSLSENHTFTIIIKDGKDIVRSKNQEIPEIIAKEIKEQIPVPIEELYIDWQASNDNKILLSAASKNIINSFTSNFKNAGHPLSIIDIKTAAILRAVTNIKNINNKIIIDIGDIYSTIILGNNNSIELSIVSEFNENTVDNIIEEKLNLSKAQAKKAKKVCGVNDTKCHGAIRKVLEPEINDLVEKIKQITVYHKDYFPNEKSIDKIILCGQGSTLKDLDKLLTEATKIETIIGNPLININNTEELLDAKKSLEFTTAIGMALRGFF